MEVDYIIVGLGLAGVCFAEQLEQNNKSFVVIDKDLNGASSITGGVYNPTVLKRFTAAWKASDQLGEAIPFFKLLEQKLNIPLNTPMRVYRKFASAEEQNNWFQAADKPSLRNYLSTTIVKNQHRHIKAPFGFGQVLNTGRIDVISLTLAYRNYLNKKRAFIKEDFKYDLLEIKDQKVRYGDICANRIVFAEGFGITKNPFFHYTPLVGNKGELLTIKAPDLQINVILKSSVFLIPLGENLFKVGATYNRNDKTKMITEEARKELTTKLNTLITCPYEIVTQEAGIRPTVADRRPLAGRHPVYPELYVLNGLGTRGVMIGPWLSKKLFDAIEKGIPLEKEIDVSRFQKRYSSR